MSVTTEGILLRPREVLERIITPVSEGERCTYCKKPIAEGRFHWLGEDGQPRRSHPSFGGEIESFPDWRHADGTPGHGHDGRLVMRDNDRCPECGEFDTITRQETGYGCNSECTACGWHKYFDRGD
jgi:hypothetical protein